MPTEVISIGPAVLMKQNVVYALPAVKTTLYTDATTPTIQIANDVAYMPITLTGGSAVVSGKNIRCTSGDISVILKRD